MGTEFWDWLNLNATGLTALATVGLVLAGVFTLLATVRDSRQRSRPMISAGFSINPNSPKTIMFHVRNYGPTRAINVQVEFTPPIKEDHETELVIRRYEKPIGVINPGEIYQNAWYIPKFESDTFVGNHYNFPDRVTVTVRYHCFLWMKYRDVTRLDVSTYLNTSETVSSDSMLGSIRKIAGAIGDRDGLKIRTG